MSEIAAYRFLRKISGVKIFSILLMLAAAWVFYQLFIPVMTLKKSITVVQSESTKNAQNAFQNLSYKFQDEKGKEMQIQTECVQQNEKNKFTINNMSGNFSLPDGNSAQISAQKIIATTENEKIGELIGNVKILLSSGLTVKTEHAFVNLDKKNSRGDTDVSISYRDMGMQAGEYAFDMEKNSLVLRKNVKGNLAQGNFVAADDLKIIFSHKNMKKFKHRTGADSKNFQQAVAEAKLSGHAKIKFEDLDLAAHEISYSPKEIVANKNLSLNYVRNGRKFFIQSQKIVAKLNETGNIDTINAIGSLNIKGNDFVVRANSGFFEKQKIYLSGNIAIANEYGEVFGDRAELNLETGDVSIKASSGVVQKI